MHEACEALARVGGWELMLPDRRIAWTPETYRIHEVDPASHTPTVENGVAFYPPEARPLLEEAVRRAIEEKRPFDLQLPFVTATGRKRWVQATGRPEVQAGRVIRVFGAIQDITERKVIEEEFLRSQRMQSIGTLAGGIAHDLNNILSPILISAELLQQSWDREAAQVILHNTRRGADLVRQILTFARGMASHPQPVAVAEAFQQISQIVAGTFPRTITMEVELPENCPAILADPTHLQQILLNLCVNARDAMPEGGRLRLRAVWEPDEPSRQILIEIGDEGTGIPEALRAQIFEPFFTTKNIGQGTGLGLSTVRMLVDQHGGSIGFVSQPGRGTTFSLRLPVAEGAAAPAEEPVALPIKGAGRRVVVVDDEPPVCAVVDKVLEAAGFTVRSATTAREALSLCLVEPPDLVITDLMMPGGSGIGLLLQVRQRHPGLPLMAMSGMPDVESLDALKKLGVPHFLPKPFTARALMEVVGQALMPAA